MYLREDNAINGCDAVVGQSDEMSSTGSRAGRGRFGLALAASQLDAEVMAQHGLGPHERLLWLELANCCHWSGPNVWVTMHPVSLASLVARTRLSLSSIKRSLAKLREAGLVVQQRDRPGGACRYRLCFVQPDVVVASTSSSVDEDDFADNPEVAQAHHQGPADPGGGSQRPTPRFTQSPGSVHREPTYQENKKNRKISHTERASTTSVLDAGHRGGASGKSNAKKFALAFTAEDLATAARGMHRLYDRPVALDAALAVVNLANALPGQAKNLTLEAAVPLRMAFEQIVRLAGSDQAAIEQAVNATITRTCGAHNGGFFPGAKAVKDAMEPELERLRHAHRLEQSRRAARGEGGT